MAITDYTSLKLAIAEWAHRDDLSGVIDTCIDLAEAAMNRVLRVSAMENRATTTCNSEYTALPSDFLEIRNIQVNVNPVVPLSYKAPYLMDLINQGEVGQPAYYTIVGNEIQVYPVPDSSYTLEISYYQKITALSDSNTTNFVLTSSPDAYLHGVLSQVYVYTKARDAMLLHSEMFTATLNMMNARDRTARYSGSPIQVRAV